MSIFSWNVFWLKKKFKIIFKGWISFSLQVEQENAYSFGVQEGSILQNTVHLVQRGTGYCFKKIFPK
jgi:hypothetical protein